MIVMCGTGESLFGFLVKYSLYFKVNFDRGVNEMCFLGFASNSTPTDLLTGTRHEVTRIRRLQL